MRNPKVQMIVEAGLMLALATILSNIKMFEMPAGGSVTLGSMIPIIIFSFRWGWKQGILVGVVYGLFQQVLGGYVIHPLQGLLDYPIAFGCLGLAGFGHKKVKELVDANTTSSIVTMSIWTLVAIFLRFVCHVLSGVIYFAPEGATFTTPAAWWGSITYNGGFLTVEAIITIAILAVISRPVMKVYLQKEA